MTRIPFTTYALLRALAALLIVAGGVIILTGGWTLAYSPIAAGLAVLVVAEVDRHRREGAAH